jgi:hypothetical protein
MSNASFELVNEIITEEMLKQLPRGPSWFSERALSAEGETGKLVRVIAEQISEWVVAIKTSRRGFMLATAVQEDLDRWGIDLSIGRMPGELDNPYRTRLLKELLRSKVTRNAVIQYVEDVTGLKTSLYEPWRDQDVRSSRTPGVLTPFDANAGRSGTWRRTSPYYQGGVVDIITVDYNRTTWLAADEVLAAGIRPFFTVLVGRDPQPISFGNPAPSSGLDIGQDKVVPLFIFEEPVRSKLGLRSGRAVHQEDAILEYTPIISYPFIIVAQGQAEHYQVDLFPSVRSVWRSEQSPRSGARGEAGFETLVPEFYGGVLVDSGNTDDHQFDRDLYYEVFIPVPITPPIMRSASGVRSGHRRLLWTMEYLRNEMVADSLLGNNQLQGDVDQYDLVPMERSVFYLERSPRSGVPNEPAPLSQPYLYGGVEAGPVYQSIVNAELEVTIDNLKNLDFGHIYSFDKYRSGFEEKVWTDILLEQNGSLMTQVFDRPDLAGNYSIYESPVTWEAVGDATWHEINILGHSVQLLGDVVIEVDP